MNDHLRIILNEIKNEILVTFPGAVPANLAQIKPQQDKIIYAVDVSNGARVETGRPVRSLSTRRDIIVRISSAFQSRGLDSQADMNNRADIMNNISSMILRIERNERINDMDVPVGAFYQSDTGLLQSTLSNDTISLSTEIKFISDTIESL